MPDSPGFMQLGGFYRLHLDDTGEKILERSKLYPSCGGWRLPADIAGFAIAEAKARVPVESDVFESLLWDIPLFISNLENDTIWAVDDAGVTDVSDYFHPDAK